MIHGPAANARILTKYTPEGSSEVKELTVPFRTLGFPHSCGESDKTLGNYEDGAWIGHLVVVAENTVIDLTIGQLNEPKYAVNFEPPYQIFEADEEFLTGEAPFIGICDDMLVCYFAFPNERTFEASDSWTKADFRNELKRVAERVARIFDGKPDSDLHAET